MIPSEELAKLRKDVDAIDQKLVKLFEKRMDICEKIGEVKMKEGVAIVDADRERVVLESAMAHVSDAHKPAVETFMRHIMEQSKARQENRRFCPK